MNIRNVLFGLGAAASLLLVGCQKDPDAKYPKIVNDPILQNTARGHSTAFQSDMWQFRETDTTVGQTWAQIDPAGAFISRVEVLYMDNVEGDEAVVSDVEAPGIRAWVNNPTDTNARKNCEWDGEGDAYTTTPCYWYAKIPRRSGIGVGSAVTYLYKVFYRDTADLSLPIKHVILGQRSVRVGPYGGYTRVDPAISNVKVGDTLESTVTFNPIPPRGAQVKFYTEPEGVLEVLGDSGWAINSVTLAANEYNKKVRVRVKSASPGTYSPLEYNEAQQIASGTAAVWAKASGWFHGVALLRVAP